MLTNVPLKPLNNLTTPPLKPLLKPLRPLRLEWFEWQSGRILKWFEWLSGQFEAPPGIQVLFKFNFQPGQPWVVSCFVSMTAARLFPPCAVYRGIFDWPVPALECCSPRCVAWPLLTLVMILPERCRLIVYNLTTLRACLQTFASFERLQCL